MRRRSCVGAAGVALAMTVAHELMAGAEQATRNDAEVDEAIEGDDATDSGANSSSPSKPHRPSLPPHALARLADLARALIPSRPQPQPARAAVAPSGSDRPLARAARRPLHLLRTRRTRRTRARPARATSRSSATPSSSTPRGRPRQRARPGGRRTLKTSTTSSGRRSMLSCCSSWTSGRGATSIGR